MCKLFELKVDAKFYADNIDDAFAKLAKHFADLADGGNENSKIFIGNSRLSIKPVEDMNNVKKEKEEIQKSSPAY